MAGLEVQIGADIKDFQKKIKEVESDVQQLANEKAIQIRLGLDTKEISAQIKDAKKTLTDLKQTARDTGASFQKDLAPKVANGGNALMQFSRIAQDAPFGIMGIGNNITATVEAFGHLQKSTGSTVGALKALAGSIVGSGGILLAVSLLTSALTYMSQNNLSVGDVLDKLSGNFDNLKKAMQDVNNEAIKNSGAEIATMNALVAVAKDETATRQERLAAVQKLQEEYPAYFGNLTKEQILNGDVTTAVKAVTFALIQKAKAQVLAGKIAENDLKILQLQQEGQKLFADYTAGKGAFAILKGATAQQFLKASADATGKSIDSLKKEQELYTKELEKSTKAANTFEVANANAVKKSKPVFNTPQVSPLDVAIKATGLEGLVSLDAMVTQIAKNVQGREGEIKTSLGRIPGYFNTSGQQALLELQNFNKAMSDIIKGGIVETLSGLGDAIGTAFSTGQNVISAVGKSLLSTLGGVLVELGKMAITTGIGILAIQTALKSLNPYVAIAAGVALVALGSAVKGGVKNLGSSASSGAGSSTGNISTGASYNSPASSTSSNTGTSSFGGGKVVFEISGQKLIGVLSNTLDANTKLGGTLGLT